MIETLPLGSSRTPSAVAAVRTEAQRLAVSSIAESDDFDFALNNPFTLGVGSYTGPFAFLWRTKDGKLHARRIGKTGRTLHEVVAD